MHRTFKINVFKYKKYVQTPSNSCVKKCYKANFVIRIEELIVKRWLVY